MKTVFTDICINYGVKPNDLLMFVQKMNPEHYSGVGRRTWFTEEGVAAIKKEFGLGDDKEGTIRALVIGTCPNKQWLFIKPNGENRRAAMRIPRRMIGKLDKKQVCARPIDDGKYEWVKA